jgi:carboxylate-amine ligase
MDAQTRVRDTAALAALVQCLVYRAAAGLGPGGGPTAPEVLEENRFLAARDGIGALFVDPAAGRCVPAGATLAALLHACAPDSERLGCSRELASVGALAARPGALRQRTVAARAAGLPGVLRAMHGDFVSTAAEPAVLA